MQDELIQAEEQTRRTTWEELLESYHGLLDIPIKLVTDCLDCPHNFPKDERRTRTLGPKYGVVSLPCLGVRIPHSFACVPAGQENTSDHTVNGRETLDVC